MNRYSTGIEAIQDVQHGRRTVTSIVEELLAHIDAVDPKIQAWNYLDQQSAIEQAKRLDSGAALPLRGLVFAAKDNIDTSDMPTAYGSEIHTGNTPARDAACIAELRLQGALLLGKTVSTEFAHVFPGKTRNPHNAEHTPGGSSSGSAAAVGSGMVHVAIGTQTTGSVIRPAAFCGAVGYKPTYGDISTSGVLANAPSFDTVGLMARSTDDIALVHRTLLHEADPAKPVTAPNRIGVCRTPWWHRADNESQQILEDAARSLSDTGMTIIDFDGNGAFADLESISQRVSGFEFAQTMGHERLYCMGQLSDDLRDGRMRTGFDTTYAQYVADKQTLETARRLMDQAFDECDIVISLAAPGPAPAGLRRTGDPVFNMPWTSLHTPTVTLPLFRAANKLPVGLQVCASRFSDQRLLSQAATIADRLTDSNSG